MSHRAPALAAFVFALTALALVPLSSATAKTASPGLIYGGVTSTDAPFVLKLERGAKTIDHVNLLVNGKCANGQTISFDATLTFEVNIPAALQLGDHAFKGGGRLSKTGAFRASGRGAENFGTVIAGMNEKIAGKISRAGAASGTYSATMTIIDKQTGATQTTCSTGTIRWTARSAPGRIFAGTTSDRQPVVVELDKAGKSVHALRFSWSANCMPTGGVQFPENLTGFRIANHAFGDSFQQSYDLNGGGKATFDYVVKGRVAKTKASGSFSVKDTITDATGAITTTCDGGSVTWSVKSG
jgi:hypothetical protein